MAPSNIASDELVPSTRVRVKASGQIEPEYALLGSYEEFPKRIEGPTVWEADDYRDNPERWTHAWSDEEVEEIEAATNKFLDAGYELTDITKVRFPKYQRCPLSGLGGWRSINLFGTGEIFRNFFISRNSRVSSNLSAKISSMAKVSSFSRDFPSSAGEIRSLP